MNGLIKAHHAAEARLYRLRLLRDLGRADFRQEAEDAVLDEMEALWYRMTPEERRLLEAECDARSAGVSIAAPRLQLPAVDVDEDAHARRGLPILQAVG